jgi:hypothetical protein
MTKGRIRGFYGGFQFVGPGWDCLTKVMKSFISFLSSPVLIVCLAIIWHIPCTKSNRIPFDTHDSDEQPQLSQKLIEEIKSQYLNAFDADVYASVRTIDDISDPARQPGVDHALQFDMAVEHSSEHRSNPEDSAELRLRPIDSSELRSNPEDSSELRQNPSMEANPMQSLYINRKLEPEDPEVYETENDETTDEIPTTSTPSANATEAYNHTVSISFPIYVSSAQQQIDFQSTSPLDLSNESSISSKATYTFDSLNFTEPYLSTTSFSSVVLMPLETSNATSNLTIYGVTSRMKALDLTSAEFSTRLTDSSSQTESDFLVSSPPVNETVEVMSSLSPLESITFLHIRNETYSSTFSNLSSTRPESIEQTSSMPPTSTFDSISTSLYESTVSPETNLDSTLTQESSTGTLISPLESITFLHIRNETYSSTFSNLSSTRPESIEQMSSMPPTSTFDSISTSSLFVLSTSMSLQALNGNNSLSSTSTARATGEVVSPADALLTTSSVDAAILAKEQIIPGFESVGPVQVLMPKLYLGLPSPDSETVYRLPQPYEKIQILVPAGAWMSPTSSRRATEQIPELTATVLSLPNSTAFPGVPCGPIVLLGPHDMLLQYPILVSVPCIEPRPSLGAGWEAVVHLYTQNTKARASSGGEWKREIRPQALAYSNGTAWGEAHILAPNAAFWISSANSGTIGLVTGFVVGGALVAAVAVVGTWAVSNQLHSNKKRAQSVFPSFPLPEEVSIEDDSFHFVFRTEHGGSRRRNASRCKLENFSQPGSGHSGEASFVVDLSVWSGQDASVNALYTSGGCTPPQFRPFPHHNLQLENQPLWLVTSPLRHAEHLEIVPVITSRFANDHEGNEISVEVIDEPEPTKSIRKGQEFTITKEERPSNTAALASYSDAQSRKEQLNEGTTQGSVTATALSADVMEAMNERRVIRIV